MSILLKIKKIFSDVDMAKISEQMLASIFSQSIGVVGILVLAKYFYAPADVGNLALFLSVASVVSVFLMLRLDLTVVLPPATAAAEKLLHFCMLTAGYLLGCLMLLLLVFNFLYPVTNSTLYFLSLLGGFLLSSTVAFQYFLIKINEFKIIAASKVIQSAIILSSQFIFYFIHKEYGLVVGNLLGLLITFIYLQNKIASLGFSIYQKVDYQYIKVLIAPYLEIILYGIPSGVTNTLYQNIPSILILAWFGKVEAGLYFFALRILQAPLQLISASIAPIYYKSANDFMQNKPSHIFNYTLKMQLLVASVVLLPVVLISYFGGSLVVFIFGAEWAGSGIYLSFLAGLFFFRSLYLPISYIAEVTNKVHIELLFNIYLLSSAVLSLYFSHLQNDFLLGVKLTTAFGIIGYAGLCAYFSSVTYALKMKNIRTT